MPKYLEISNSIFDERIKKAYSILENCTLCPRNCKITRYEKRGYCKSGIQPIISSYGPHFGEESPLVGTYGSGTIFFTNCNLGCIFCQNYDISHFGDGREITCEELAEVMLYLQKISCHNINFVTPTHFTPQILKSLKIAREKGLNIPLVYNCGGYENVETLKLLDGIIDIYMPDFKFSDNKISYRYCNADNYFEIAKLALKEMYRQVGDLVLNSSGIAERGIILRHLVLPDNLAGTEKVMKFISEEVSKNMYINIMDQYRPCYKAKDYPELNRRITNSELKFAIDLAKKYKLYCLDEKKLTKIFKLYII